MPKVFVTRPIPEKGIQVLLDAFGESSVVVSAHDRVISRAELLEGIRGSDALLCILTDRIDAASMDAAGNCLKVIANYFRNTNQLT